MKKIILVGKCCSGKDYLRKSFESNGYKYGITYTTREKRENEMEGVDYHFVSKDYFKDLINSNGLIEYDYFNHNYYGTPLHTFYENDLFIMTPGGVNQLSPEIRSKANVVFLDISENLQLERIHNYRNMSDKKIKKRIESDKEAFQEFNDYDYYIFDFNSNHIDEIINQFTNCH